MQQFKRNKRNSSLGETIGRVVLISIGVFLLFLIVRALVGSARLSSLHTDEFREELASKRALIAKINELENTIATYNTSIEQATLIKEENTKLKSELGRTVGHKGILARVLTAPNRNFYTSMIIDAGEEEGITVGQVAYAFESVALGTVESVEPHRATVQLFSAPGRETVGTAEGSDVSITLIGRGAGEYEVRMPRDVHFSIGEKVSYQSIDSAVLVTIEKIVTDPRDPFQRLLAKAPVNLSALKFVIVK